LRNRSTTATKSLSDSLKQNANAVVRLEQMDIVIASQRDMNIANKRVITVFNEKGLASINGYEDYGKRKSIKDIHATVYDETGKEIKRIKRKDFKDVNAGGGWVFYSDERYLFLDYTPVKYPFTIVYECETQTSNTAFLSPWLPIADFYTAIEKSVIDIRFPTSVGFKKKEFNFSGYKIAKSNETETGITYTATNIQAQKPEIFCPDTYQVFPKVIFGLENFNLESIDGSAKSWKDFGQWYWQKILAGTEVLPEATVSKMKSLVGNETDPLKKARLIYDYVQQKSRYVAIMVGIGGWKPMPAADVDRLGYGDCKALTNYTKALLAAVDVPSYYTIVYGDRDITNIEADFVSMQGNHVILTIPDGKDYVWLECTSQDVPFGYQAKFTDDRNVLVIKPDGAEIVRTKNYNDKSNAQFSKGRYAISETGSFSGNIAMTTEGSQYRYDIEKKLPIEKEAHYKEYWDNISNLKIKKAAFANDKQKIIFTENLELEAENYGNLSGGRMMFAVNAYNTHTGNIKRIRDRKMPFEMQRGSYDEDEITVELPQGFAIEALPKNFELSGKYGDYKTELVLADDHHLVYKRSFLVKKGLYPSKEYEDFRQFMEQVSRNDNAKIVLIKNQ
jgi:hypothetical protein